MKKDRINIELRSEALNEVLSTPPFWLVRSGNTLLFFAIFLILGLSYLIKYPDEIAGEVSLYRNRPPVEFQNQQYGRLVQLYVRDGEIVCAGKILAQFENETIPHNMQDVWIAPLDGQVLFNQQLNVPDFYKAGQATMVLVSDRGHYKGVMTVSSFGSGKIKKGQRVLIELSDYPKSEYGALEGEVKSITSVSRDDTYEVEIVLPNQLLTTHHVKIPERAILKGSARIITSDKRLLERFFENVIDLF